LFISFRAACLEIENIFAIWLLYCRDEYIHAVVLLTALGVFFKRSKTRLSPKFSIFLFSPGKFPDIIWFCMFLD